VIRSVVAAVFIVSTGAYAEDEPFAMDKPLSSPRGSFSIIQHRDENWTTTIHFAHGGQPDLLLTEDYPWPALFYISPDDHWILQVQKSGSGDNISFLYRLDSDGRLWRMEQRLGELAFAFLKRRGVADFKDLYHTGIAFQSWDVRAAKLLFSIHGSSLHQSGEGIDLHLVYDLKRHSFEQR
jgi:hypothetical protein